MGVATDKAHVSSILSKLDLDRRTQIALLGHDAGLRWPNASAIRSRSARFCRRRRRRHGLGGALGNPTGDSAGGSLFGSAAQADI
jgi:hypothetical protein